MKNFIKKITSFMCGMVFTLSGLNFNALAAEEETRICRASVQTYNESGDVFTNTLVAYDNGRIHVEIQKEDIHVNYPVDGITTFNNNVVGYMSFNDTVIAPLGERGTNGTSNYVISGLGLVENHSYNEKNIIYTFIYNSDHSAYRLCKSYDFYVKDNYKWSIININFFGEELEIPFGDNVIIDYAEENKKLINQLIEANQRIEELTSENELLKKNYGDINLDGKYTIGDAVLLMRYIAGTIPSIPYTKETA